MSGTEANAAHGDTVSTPYWQGALSGSLILQRCGHCGRVRHYPRVLCEACWSFEVEHFESAGLGTIYSWTVAHHAFSPDVAADVPYVLATVELAEGVRVLGRLNPATEPEVGLQVRTEFAPHEDGMPILMVLRAG